MDSQIFVIVMILLFATILGGLKRPEPGSFIGVDAPAALLTFSVSVVVLYYCSVLPIWALLFPVIIMAIILIRSKGADAI